MNNRNSKGLPGLLKNLSVLLNGVFQRELIFLMA
jgi:hypothetical protein